MMRENGNTDLVDIISSLPDCILGLILSFLSTKEAVFTSLVSKRWKLVWVTVHNLDFNYVGCWKEHNKYENRNFVRFVDRVLLLNDVGVLNKFSLVWHPWCISSHCNSWINTALARNVRHLSLSGEFDFPVSVLGCDSLQSLELKGRIYVPDVLVVCLPRLKSVKLEGVDFHSEEAFEKLINGCSMLNYLSLDIYSNDDDGFTYIIYSTSLRHFELRFKHKCSLKLKACSLEYLEVFSCIAETFAQENLSSLVGAYFSIHLNRDEFIQDDFCNSIVEAVRAFDHEKALNLSADGLQPITKFHPDRVFNMLWRQSLRPDNKRKFVLHEAVLPREIEDQMYDIFQLLPPKIQVGLFTATVVPEMARESMNKAVRTYVKYNELSLKGIGQSYVKVENEDGKLETLYNLYETMHSISSIVVFVNTRRKADWLTDKMRGRGHTVYAIHGDINENMRETIMHYCHSGASDYFCRLIRAYSRFSGPSIVLITTNLFAGGVCWTEHADLMINYDLPTQPEKYLHRSGRFGGEKGTAITFTTPDEERIVFEIQKFYNVEVKKCRVGRFF